MPVNRWSDVEAAALKDELALLAYRSRLLGEDVTIVNRGGGNTSAKRILQDHRGETVSVLTVKASGFDLRGITEGGFTDVRLDDALRTRSSDEMNDEAMVSYLDHAVLHPQAPRPSIETLLHAFLPAAHVDHTHADAPLALCTAAEGETLVRRLFGEEALWVPYLRSGFRMARLVAEALAERPKARAVFLQKHGLLTWGEDSKACYLAGLEFINRCDTFVNERAEGRRAFGGARVMALDPEPRRALAARYLPVLRGALSAERRVVIRYDESPQALTFASSREGPTVAQEGLACPDHVLVTGVRPLTVEWEPGQGFEALTDATRRGAAAYEEAYRAYFQRNSHDNVAMQEPRPRIVLVPGLGMFTSGKDLRAATVTAETYHRAMAIMRGASAVGRFTSLTEREAFEVEYWPLELYKLTLQPLERELARRIALVTGGAGAIGRAIAARFAEAGAHVVVADVEERAARDVAQRLVEQFGPGTAKAVRLDVTDETSVRQALRETVLTYGGLDVLVASAGYATSRPLQELPLEEWQRTFEVLVTGTFLLAREAVAVMRQQQVDGERSLGGSIVLLASKAGLAPAREAAAYGSAKAAVLHFARSLAEEVGSDGIRVNSLAPDAIIEGSGLWAGQWGQARAHAHGVPMEDLPDFYRQRNALKVNVTAEDVAEAALFFASERAKAITGAVLTVDGGLRDAYVR